ncbi:MAG: hypothetical protein ACOWYE_02470 [Desulfatiglandales bacterium]
MLRDKQELVRAEKIEWLAKSIFREFPEEVQGLKFHVLDCGCIYYQRVFRDGSLDPRISVYRDAGRGTCDTCMLKAVHWRQMVCDIVVVYNLKFEVTFSGDPTVQGKP